MRTLDYVQEKLVRIALNLIGPTALYFYLGLWGVASSNRIAIVIVWLLLALAVYSADFLKRRRYYSRLFVLLEGLDQKYLIADMLEPAPFIDARLFRDVLEQAGAAMLTEIGQSRLSNREYREYIEAWVHQIKTPIAAAKLVADNNPDPATVSMVAEVDRIEKLVEQALYYARSTSVDRDCFIREVPLEQVVRITLRRYARYFIEAHMAVELHDLDKTIYTDSKWLEFILGQVFANALQYSRSGQPRLTIRATEEHGGVTLQVTDNGIGIPEADLPRVCDRAFTGSNGRVRGQATGMGLYLVKSLCGKLGHDVTVQSKPGEYTKVTFSFPKGRLLKPEEGAPLH